VALMTNIENIRRTDRTVQKWWKEVSDAAQTFEARWMTISLQRVNPELADALQEQRDIFDQMTITGSSDDVEVHGAATCRGFAAATRAMEAAEIGDTAYWLGSDPVTGFKLAVGPHKGSARRVREIHGPDYIFHSPDELAAILGERIADGDRTAGFLTSVKQLYADAEMVRHGKKES
jgi:hypothetical protein